MDALTPTAWPFLVSGIAIGFVVAWLLHLLWRARYTGALRKDAVSRSRAVTGGKIFEQFAPFHAAFPFNPQDARFVGSPIDFVVFDGLSEGSTRRVVFVEVKTGSATLSARERDVRDAVQSGRVEWHEVREG